MFIKILFIVIRKYDSCSAVKLVETVLIPAETIAAISNPVTPAGKPVAIKYGNTLSPDPGNFNSAGKRSGWAV